MRTDTVIFSATAASAAKACADGIRLGDYDVGIANRYLHDADAVHVLRAVEGAARRATILSR